MNEEEKQAIETMHTIVEFGGDNLLCREHRERLQTVLNLIEKQEKKIEGLERDKEILLKALKEMEK